MASLCYKMMGGTNWVRNVLLTTALFCGPMLACFSFLNTVAIIYRVGTASPFDIKLPGSHGKLLLHLMRSGKGCSMKAVKCS